MNSSLFQEESELYLELEKDITHTYQLLTSSRYVNNRNLELVCNDAKNRVNKPNRDEPWVALLVYMRGIYTYTLLKGNYQEFERRFSYFFQSLSHDILDLVRNIEPSQYRQFINKLLNLVIENQQRQLAPWPSLLLQLVQQMPTEHIDAAYSRLTKKIDTVTCSRELALTYSYLALLAGKEMTALTVLQQIGNSLKEVEATLHFQLLKERGRWRTMKQWVHTLYAKKKNSHYGSLQKYVDEMNSVLPVSSKEQELIWERWLLSPNFERFQTYSKHLSLEQQEDLLDRLLPELEQRLHQLEAAKTYEKLLLHYKKYEVAVRYLLKHERDPLRLREEKVQLLQAIQSHDIALARPVYHQFIVRLVEKKSRIYYEQAASYLKELQSLYVEEEDQILFASYVKRLKKMYRTYRAFVEEMKRIGL
ncbi:hypothetical protein N0O92_05080 [Alkalihalobacillus sp. MEB130]|uniref:hypothetical protein n=1 Tax=Alkalihalobacillus sp. MEB130 TaxID=2976704 RepID=UPI0028DDC07F|nr:hypothetical protein [Alkalihalobacillus sp. MEB130]MDT8859599.1 hypothetical protein [Alkalihalobacillus sp. MEB130]